METNRQKKIGGLSKRFSGHPARWSEKKGVSNLIISVSKVTVTTDLSVASLFKRFPKTKQKILEQ
jgi:ribosome-binding factor A